jgi:hypothetical protein
VNGTVESESLYKSPSLRTKGLDIFSSFSLDAQAVKTTAKKK